MKKVVFLFLSILLTAGVFAQEPGAAEKNAGNTALKAKNYAEAFKKYEEYLKIVNNNDKATVFNTAYCANKIKDYPAAEKYFDMSIKNKYKVASAYLGKAQALKGQNKTAEMIATLQEGMKASPGNMKLETMYAAYYLKEGQKYQKAGNEAKAAENYNKITSLTNKSFKTQGLVSLAGLFFNNGAKILQDATPFANTDKAKYDAEKGKAVADFKKAKDYLVEAQSLEPANKDVKDLLAQVNAALK